MERYFTSDLHIADKAIARWRGFSSLTEHDAMILDGLNATVAAQDELWILGDICHSNLASIRSLRSSIACAHVHVIIGNHDKRSLFETLMHEEHLFESVGYYAEVGKVRREGYKFCLSHYPMLDWNRATHGSYMLHGHIHSLPDNGAGKTHQDGADKAHQEGPRDVSQGGMGMRGYNTFSRDKGIRRYDVGVDANGYRPVSAEQIVSFLPDDATWRAMHGLPDDWV